MVPVPLSWATAALVVAVGSVIIAYEGVPLLMDGRVDRAFQEGRVVEQQAWEELRRRTIAVQEAERQKAQAKIAAAERDYWSRQALDVLKITELEKALEEERTDGRTDPEKPAGADGAACPPAFSQRMRDALDPIGRD